MDANNMNLDQIAHKWAVWSWSIMFAILVTRLKKKCRNLLIKGLTFLHDWWHIPNPYCAQFETKYKAISEVEKGQKSKSAIAKEFNIPASTLSTWLKNATSIKESYHKFGPKRKNSKVGSFDDVENAIFKWFSNVREQNVPVSGPILLAKAEEFSQNIHVYSGCQ